MDFIIKTVRALVIGFIRSYQMIVSPFFAGSCRHIPTCSQYAIDAVERFGVLKGIYFSARRLARCRPCGTSGYDPIPSKDEN